MKNTVTVEVFNADGSLAQREVKKNYVTEGYLKNIEAYARGLIYSGTSLSGAISNGYGLSEFVLLTNNSDAVDTTDGVFTDALVGLSYTDSNTLGAPLGGSRNSAESYRSNKEMKLVIDFATDRANGTFQTVHLGNDSDDPITTDNNRVNGFTVASLLDIPLSTATSICADATYLYIPEGDDTIHRYNKTTYQYVDAITLATPTSSSIYDIETDGTHFYITTGTAGDTIEKYTLAGAQVTTLSITNPYGITIVGSTIYYNNSSGSLYTLDTGLVGPATFVGTLPYILNRITTDGTDIIGVIGGEILASFTTAAALVTYYGLTPYDVNGLAHKTGDVYFTAGANNIGLTDASTPYNVISRARLDSPVTKNNTQTMKVTYLFEFNIDI